MNNTESMGDLIVLNRPESFASLGPIIENEGISPGPNGHSQQHIQIVTESGATSKLVPHLPPAANFQNPT